MFYYYFPICSVKVKFHLFTQEQGGRENGIKNNYRPDHALSDDGVLTIGTMWFLDSEQLSMNTGETANMYVDFLVSNNSKSKVLKLKKGDKWKVFEGKRCVGECEMIERVTTDEELKNL